MGLAPAGIWVGVMQVWDQEGRDAPPSLAFWAPGSHRVVITGENRVIVAPRRLFVSLGVSVSHTDTCSSPPTSSPRPQIGPGPPPLTPGLALLSWGPGEAAALTCNRATCRGNDAHTNAAPLASGATGVPALAFLQCP